MKYATLEDTIYFWFGSNDTSGSGDDGSTPVFDVRLAGAAASAIPVLSGSGTLLTHANYPPGAHEIAVAATAANGFAAGNTYAVFCTLLVDSQNPTGFVGSFDLKPVESNIKQIDDDAQSMTDLKDLADNGYDPATNKIEGVKLSDVTTDITNGVELADDTITSAKYDESTAFPITSVDSGNTQIARTGADGDTMETLSDQIDLQATLAINSEARLSELDAANIPADIDGIKAKTDDLTFTEANEVDCNVIDKTSFSLSDAAIDAIWDEVLADISAESEIQSGASITPRKSLRAIFNRFYRTVTQTATQQVVKNDSDGADIATMTVSDDGTTQTKGRI